MKKMFLLLFAIILSPYAVAQDYLEEQIIATDNDHTYNKNFTSAHEAAFYASAKYNPQSIDEDVEYIGGIIENESASFYFTVNKGKKHRAIVISKLVIPTTHKLSAVWHTHGARRNRSKFFSDYDTSIANGFGVPIYMVNSDNVLKIFKPGDKTFNIFSAEKHGLGRFKGYAEGAIIGPLK